MSVKVMQLGWYDREEVEVNGPCVVGQFAKFALTGAICGAITRLDDGRIELHQR